MFADFAMDNALAERVIANLLEQNEAQKAELSQARGAKLSHEDSRRRGGVPGKNAPC